ncbi:hypothetical protein FOL47_001071 [Perkinsus chesapeaki]|uniref:Uncharacterized protein n=1 Tax=Perkinsus chesapeaki TaxID=330153 RepID=A0A7J6KTM2_PERCH|nr:hypothetical protein FOL47_001071 [Perkinsus chesapeaki]
MGSSETSTSAVVDLDGLHPEVLALARDFDKDSFSKIAQALIKNKLFSLEMIQAIARREDLRNKLATEAKLEFPDMCVLNALFDRALLEGKESAQPRPEPTPDLGTILVEAGKRFGNLPDPSMLPANPNTINKMMKVQSAINIDMREFHPLRDLQSQASGGLVGGSIPLRACGKTGAIILDRDADFKKITSFTDFTCCFLRFAQTMSVFHPLTTAGKNVSSPDYVPGVSFYDLLAYWRRLYDNAGACYGDEYDVVIHYCQVVATVQLTARGCLSKKTKGKLAKAGLPISL